MYHLGFTFSLIHSKSLFHLPNTFIKITAQGKLLQTLLIQPLHFRYRSPSAPVHPGRHLLPPLHRRFELRLAIASPPVRRCSSSHSAAAHRLPPLAGFHCVDLDRTLVRRRLFRSPPPLLERISSPVDALLMAIVVDFACAWYFQLLEDEDCFFSFVSQACIC